MQTHFWLRVALHNVASAVGVVLVWRCIWVLFDEFVYSNNKVLSALVGGLIGVAALLCTNTFVRDW